MRPAAAKIREWREKPHIFVREVLRATPDEWQDEVLRAYGMDPEVNPEKKQRFALKASKGPGKSTLEAWIGLHFMTVWKHPKAVATSISGDNLRDNLWAELSKWQHESEFLKDQFEWTAERFFCKDFPETWWISARQWPKSADTAQQANTLAGVHADHVLFLVDEAGGIPSAVVATAEGGLANAAPGSGRTAILFMSGNPTHLSGPLYKACTSDRRLWWVKEISGDPDDPKRAPRVSVQWAREQIELFGRDNPWVLINVFGQFPPSQSNALLGVEDVNAAMKRLIPETDYFHETRILGVDVARKGDDRSVFYKRQGRMGLGAEVFRNLDLMTLVGRVSLTMKEWKPHVVCVDATGVGAGVVDRLRQLGHKVEEIHSAASPTRTSPKFLNKRAEMWWDVADWVKSGGCLRPDSELLNELTAPTFDFTAQNAIRLESKDLLKARGLASPDIADALALTFAQPGLPAPDIIEKNLNQSGHVVHDYDPHAEALPWQ